jgi:DNA-binding NtrC family response regulator
LGAYDFISKPFKKDEIVMVLKKAEERERLKHENSMLKQALQVRAVSAASSAATRSCRKYSDRSARWPD